MDDCRHLDNASAYQAVFRRGVLSLQIVNFFTYIYMVILFFGIFWALSLLFEEGEFSLLLSGFVEFAGCVIFIMFSKAVIQLLRIHDYSEKLGKKIVRDESGSLSLED